MNTLIPRAFLCLSLPSIRGGERLLLAVGKNQPESRYDFRSWPIAAIRNPVPHSSKRVQRRKLFLTILCLSACGSQPAGSKFAQAVSPLFFKCLQSHCIDSSPGARPDSDDPDIKQEYFDRCLAETDSSRGSTDHAKEMDKCMAAFGYFRSSLLSTEDSNE